MLSKTLSVTLSAALLALAGGTAADSAKLVNPANSHSYQRFDTRIYWNEAKAACEAAGGYLATITSQAEQDWVWANIGPNPGYAYTWIGGSQLVPGDVLSWGAWITGETWSYTNWRSGFPNYTWYVGTATHLEIAALGGGTWTNSSGDYYREPYLCEWGVRQYLDTAVIFRAARLPAGTPLPMPALTVTDYAALVRDGEIYFLYLLNGATGQVVASASLGDASAVTPTALTVTDHMGRALVTVLIKQADGSSISRVYDATTAALLRTITLPH